MEIMEGLSGLTMGATENMEGFSGLTTGAMEIMETLGPGATVFSTDRDFARCAGLQ